MKLSVKMTYISQQPPIKMPQLVTRNICQEVTDKDYSQTHFGLVSDVWTLSTAPVHVVIDLKYTKTLFSPLLNISAGQSRTQWRERKIIVNFI